MNILQVNQLERELEQLKQRFRTAQAEVRSLVANNIFVNIFKILSCDLFFCKNILCQRKNLMYLFLKGRINFQLNIFYSFEILSK